MNGNKQIQRTNWLRLGSSTFDYVLGKMTKEGEEKSKEEEAMERLDDWLLSSTERIGLGLGLGFLGSVLVRRRWPIILGLGMALGQAAAEFREDQHPSGPQKKNGGHGNGEKAHL